jgi:hypothetical protein
VTAAAKIEAVERLEAAGFAASACATRLRDVRQRFGVHDDLTVKLDALEQQARTVASEVIARLHDIEECASYGDPTAARRS